MSFYDKKHSILGMLPLFSELQTQGINPEVLLQKHDIDLDAMSATTLLNVEAELAIVAEALEMVDDPLFGLNVGNQVTITAYGMFALLLLSAPTMKEVVDVSVRYQRLSLAFTEISAFYQEGFVEVRSTLPDVPEKLKHFIADRDFAGNAVFIREIQDAPHRLILACGMARPSPNEKHLQDYTRLLGLTPHFDQPFNWIRIPVTALTAPSKHSNELAHKLFKVQAQELMRNYYSDSGDIVAQINLVLDGCSTHYPKISQISDQFKISESTLRRQLQQRKTSYRSLVDNHRKKRALATLEVESPSITDLAERLGYADAMGFLKAFKKWTGQTPKQYMLAKARRL